MEEHKRTEHKALIAELRERIQYLEGEVEAFKENQLYLVDAIVHKNKVIQAMAEIER